MPFGALKPSLCSEQAPGLIAVVGKKTMPFGALKPEKLSLD